MPSEPYPKSKQLARGQKRYRRKVASAKTWAKLADEKIGPCRVCTKTADNGRVFGRIEFHHVVPRDRGGDDVADNLVPLCPDCHAKIERRERGACLALVMWLTDSEYAYAVEKCGEPVWESVYGITYER